MSERKKVGLYLDADLWKRVRTMAVDRDLSASSLVELALSQWLSAKDFTPALAQPGALDRAARAVQSRERHLDTDVHIP